ncbi:MAG: alpha/beta hydrolase [Burkholderiales bacterium]|nr:alpha/beta hydrolase [Burkholderiales bacterium]
MKVVWIVSGLVALLVAVAGLVAASPAAALNLLAAVDSRRVAEGQAYGPLARQRYDLYRPAGAAPAGGWPLVLFFYGGAWNRGERADYRFVGEALAARGIVVMVADYRLHPEVRYPDFLRDGAAATAHALAMAGQWGASPRRLVLMGHSAGAYNAAMLALDARWLREAGHRPAVLAGWVGLAGPYDFLPITTPEVQAVFHLPAVPPDSQPIRHVGAAPLPALLAAGLADERVNPLRNTRQLAAALRQQGAPVQLREYAGLDHGRVLAALARPLQGLAPVLDDVAGFVLGLQDTGP